MLRDILNKIIPGRSWYVAATIRGNLAFFRARTRLGAIRKSKILIDNCAHIKRLKFPLFVENKKFYSPKDWALYYLKNKAGLNYIKIEHDEIDKDGNNIEFLN